MRDVRLLFSLRPSASDFAPSSPIIFRKRLQTSEQPECQRAANACFRQGGAAYLSSFKTLLIFSASAKLIAPSSPMLFILRLQTRVRLKCQRVLTLVFGRGRGGVLELCEGLVCLEALSKLCCALISDVVGTETANKRADKVSEGDDT